jgi:indolepyruvate ferredoxin oxidoreductase, alpha subunit
MTAVDAVPRALLMGNEAIARGAVEGGVAFCSGYPGNPSSEIIDTLLKTRVDYPIHVEWSVNEIVALEAAAAASFAGLKALVAMKQNGVNVCVDFLTTVNLTGTNGGGLVVVVCDDPGPLTSSNEEDSRLVAKLAMLPLLEPATPQEAKDMTAWALSYSAEKGLPVLLRSVSRLSHGRAGVRLGPAPDHPSRAHFDVGRPLLGLPHVVTANHRRLKTALAGVSVDFDASPFNSYTGPDDVDLLVVAAGLGWLYALEAVARLGLEDRVGVLKMGTVFPFPAALVAERLRRCRRVLVVEQIEPFVEEELRLVHSAHAGELGGLPVFGKGSGHLPAAGEIDTDAVVAALAALLREGDAAGVARPPASAQQSGAVSARPPSYDETAGRVLSGLPPRDISFCQGCPHRASFWAIKTALALDGRDGFVAGDIGCYGLAAGPTGYSLLKTLHCMGAGIGEASGFGVLRDLGFTQPVVAVAGDSTFYHACIPALINARVQDADLVFVILDNSTTAMTGFQPDPGSPCTPADPDKWQIPAEDVCRALGVDTTVVDPVEDVGLALRTVYEGLQRGGVHAVVMRSVCATFHKKSSKASGVSLVVDPGLCQGEACGCDRFCTRVLGCVGNRWDAVAGKAYIEADFCNGCGLCAQLCPRGAIVTAPGTAEVGS